MKVDINQIGKIAPELKAGQKIEVSGVIYTARDAAHKKLTALLQEGKELPFSLEGASIYYAGPTAAPKGMPIGSCGPTTSSRMDPYSPLMLDSGLKCMIGKGPRSKEVIEAIRRNKAVYFCAVGGAGALAAQAVKKAEIIAFPELGCEAIRKLTVESFPLYVGIDCSGGSMFEE